MIATGRHVKYLPGSFLQSIALGPLLPLSKLICDNFIENKTYSDSMPSASIDDLLEIKDLSPDNKLGKLSLGKFHNNPHGTFHVSTYIHMYIHMDHSLSNFTISQY